MYISTNTTVIFGLLVVNFAQHYIQHTRQYCNPQNHDKDVPVLAGVEKEPKPWAATEPAPVLKVPPGFWSTNEEAPNWRDFAPLVPNKLAPPTTQIQSIQVYLLGF